MKTKFCVKFSISSIILFCMTNLCVAQTNFSFDTSLNNAQQQLQKQNDKFIMVSTKETDYFIDPAGSYEKSNAPLLLKRIDNTKPFTFTTKLTAEHKVKYDAGMAFIYV